MPDLSGFTRPVQNDYGLQNKHNFKKKAGNAKWYYQLFFDESLENDLNALAKAYQNNIPFRIFGAHTNLFITENGYDGLFVDISLKNSKVIFDEAAKTFTVTSNTTVAEFVNFTMDKGYDFAALTGIPGMMGSGLVGNSGYTPSGKMFSDFVVEAIVFDFEENRFIKIVPDETFFSTRNSTIKQSNKDKTRYFVKELVLKSEFIGKEKVREKFDAQISMRRESLKISFKEGNAGSLWSNAHLQTLGIKSFPSMLKENPSINQDFNGATYSPNNRLFITSEATRDKDAARLFVHTLEKVKALYGVELHKEVIILDKDGEIDTETFIKNSLN